MKFCPMCGAKVIGNNQKFCAECGFKLVIGNSNTNEVKVEVQNDKKGFQPANKKIEESFQVDKLHKENTKKTEELSAKELEDRGTEAQNKKDYKKARELFEKAYEKGNKDIALRIGMFYANGQGVTKDERLADKWFKKASKKIDGEDKSFMLACMYYKGLLLPRNIEKAVTWFRIAANEGNIQAAFILGNFYYQGDEIKRDIAQAIKWLEIASRANNYEAAILLSGIYLDGIEGKRDSKRGIALLEGAANAGVPQAMEMLAFFYENGNIDIKADKYKAKKWHEKAIQAGYKG
ncbi:tetratricopeptide repeat protein [Selenomonas ruminantium]|uniref:tetratricopeptide repeat protein n=1 Tax=Selenomonas ruminantium TaxID=971 RepID=UPI0026EA164A|nr:hypothetical protein [Selenomonas ruminantium]